jgi:hypothetical protein
MKKPKIPEELGPAGRRLWKEIVDEYEILDSGGRAHLLTACRAEDDIQRMRATIAREGDICATDRSRAHPLHAAIRGAETVRRQSLRALNLDVGPEKTTGPGRSPL